MTTQLMPDTLAHPPPFEMDLVDADRVVGWIIGKTIGFLGFRDGTEATHAAWIAHRALARRIARTHGMRLIPIGVEPLTLERSDDGTNDVILATNRPIATLITPGSHSRVSDSFGFELTVPSPMSEFELRGVAYLMYRTLRKSGVRWALWRPATPAPTARTVEGDSGVTAPAREPVKRPRRRPLTRTRGALRRLGNRLRLTPEAIRDIARSNLTVYK
jgi:hypothetical protein